MSDGSTNLPVKPEVMLPAAAAAPPALFMPVMSLQQAKARRDEFVSFVKECLVEDLDYGKVPGSDRPALLKPGAEKLNTLFGLVPTFDLIERTEDWTGKDHGVSFFYYFYKCRLWRGDRCQGEGDGSCNSMESKYRYRWVPKHEIPSSLDPKNCKTRGGVRSEFEFAIEKAETGGQYGKPAEYWKQFQDAIQERTARAVQKQTRQGKMLPAWEIDSTVYRIPNEDAPDQVNTIQKMAQKRALVAATLIAVNASDFFTQDVEEMETSDLPPRAAGPPPPSEAPPPYDPQRSKEPPTEEEQRLRATRLFQDICKICDPEHQKDFSVKLTAHLEHYLGDKISTADPHSLVTKLAQVWDRETKTKGAGKAWVEETAAKHAATPGPEPVPDRKPAARGKKAPRAGNGKPSLGTLYAKVCQKAGKGDGATLLNAYIVGQLGLQPTEMLSLQPEQASYERCFTTLAALNDMETPQIRHILVPKDDTPLPGITDEDIPFE